MLTGKNDVSIQVICENPWRSQLRGFSMPFGPGGLHLRLATAYFSLSNHLQI